MRHKLMIVAHPDDETIFGGAALIRKKGWKVICVTNKYNVTRAREFKKAMRAVRAKHEMWGFLDRRDGGFGSRKSLIMKLKRGLRKRKYRKIVTHGLRGEYGHPQHKELSRLLHRLVGKNLYVFSRSSRRLKRRLLVRKIRILRHYKSQWYMIRRLKGYIFREKIRRVK